LIYIELQIVKSDNYGSELYVYTSGRFKASGGLVWALFLIKKKEKI